MRKILGYIANIPLLIGMLFVYVAAVTNFLIKKVADMFFYVGYKMHVFFRTDLGLKLKATVEQLKALQENLKKLKEEEEKESSKLVRALSKDSPNIQGVYQLGKKPTNN